MFFFYSVFQESTQINAISEGKFCKFKGEQFVILKKNSLDLMGVLKKTGKIVFVSSSNLFKNFFFMKSFGFKIYKKPYVTLLDHLGSCSIGFFKNSGNFFISSKKNIQKKSQTNTSGFFIASLNKKFLIFLVCTIGKLKFCFSIKKNKLDRPILSEKAMFIKNNSTICYSIINLESEDKNHFATIETNYKRPYDKFLVFYEINLRSNSINRKIISKINNTSYLLIPFENFHKNENIFICSEKVITLMDYGKNRFSIQKIPGEKKRKKSHLFSSFGVYKSEKNMLYVLSDQFGNLFSIFITKNKEEEFFKIKYLDTMVSSVKSIMIMSNGFLFLNMEGNNHFYFQFLSLPSKKSRTNDFFFYPSYKKKHLRLIDELSSFSHITSFEILKNNKFRETFLVLICGSNSRSSLRILEKSCSITLNGFSYLKSKPTGIEILKREKFFNIFISYVGSTSSYFFKNNFEETKDNFIISDDTTLKIEFLKNENEIFQTVSRKIRIISNKSLKKKIIEWKPYKAIIISSNLIETQFVYFLVFLSNGKCVLLSFREKNGFIQLQSVELNNKNLFSIYGISLGTKIIRKWDFLVFFSRTEKMFRIYSITSKNFMVLIGIYILPIFPQSAKIFVRKKKIFLIIGLQNGSLMKGFVNFKNGRIEKQKIIILGKSSLNISSNYFQKGVIIFGEKIWYLKIRKNQKEVFKCLDDDSPDLVEILENYIFSIKGVIIKISKLKKKKLTFSKILKYNLIFFPIFFCIQKKDIRTSFMIFIFSHKISSLLEHNFIFNKKKKKIIYNLNQEKNFIRKCTKGIVIFIFHIFKKKKEVEIVDQIIIRGSNSNKNITGILSKNYGSKDKNILVVSMVSPVKDFFGRRPVLLAKEKNNVTGCVGFFTIQKKTIYFFKKGGRKILKNRLCYIFEDNCPSFMGKNNEFFIQKAFFGKRILICYQNNILITEIINKRLKTILILICSFDKISDIDSNFNFLMISDVTRGLKFFKFCPDLEKHKVVFENFEENNIVESKFLNLFSFYIINKIGNLKFFKINVSKNKENTNCFKTVSLTAGAPKKIYFSKINSIFFGVQKKFPRIFFASYDGTLGIIYLISKKKDIEILMDILLLVDWKKKKAKYKFIDYFFGTYNFFYSKFLKKTKIL